MSAGPSLRGAKRRSNPAGVGSRSGLLRFARNDGLAVIALTLAAPAFAQSALPPSRYAYSQLENPRQEAQAKALMETLRCLVCQGQSIADSDADMAGDMRALVRERIAAGEKPEAIRSWLIDRYGAWVSYRPTVEPITWPLWAAPLVLVALGLFLARGRFRRKAR
ncbi:MAG: cytochrome c-type biosis protein CcmH [Sphingomonadales bacterium]|nr:cytochrome c-type biosis protein CcmH [Sphingomonadales bacterium]